MYQAKIIKITLRATKKCIDTGHKIIDKLLCLKKKSDLNGYLVDYCGVTVFKCEQRE